MCRFNGTERRVKEKDSAYVQRSSVKLRECRTPLQQTHVAILAEDSAEGLERDKWTTSVKCATRTLNFDLCTDHQRLLFVGRMFCRGLRSLMYAFDCGSESLTALHSTSGAKTDSTI
jgi:hypothetical protein